MLPLAGADNTCSVVYELAIPINMGNAILHVFSKNADDNQFSKAIDRFLS